VHTVDAHRIIVTGIGWNRSNNAVRCVPDEVSEEGPSAREAEQDELGRGEFGMASLVGELVQRREKRSANAMRRVHVHFLWSARSVFGGTLVRHHEREIVLSGKGDDIGIRVELHDVTATVEGDPNRSNGAPARW